MGCAEAGGFRLLCFADGLAKLCAGARDVVFVLEERVVDGESVGVRVCGEGDCHGNASAVG